ncbi:Glycerol kinase [uncultured archaeon]|nr:Glycerol kinase [uncultured archaeon]
MENILSIDAGTTAFKTSLFDETGRLLGISTREYELLTPTTLAVELPAETFWNALKSGIKDLVKKTKIKTEDIRVLGLSVQGETLLMIDKKGNPLRNAIIWLDNRAQKEAEVLSKQFDIDGISYKTTGQVKIVPTWPASKIFWIRKHEKNVFEKVYKFLLLEDYLIYRMTNEFVAEGSLLCSTVYWNITTKKYWDEMLDYLHVSVDQLPSVRESGEAVGELKPEVAKELGLSRKTIVATGVLDQAAGAIGVGNIKPGTFSENTGAALAICATLKKPIFDKQARMPIHYHGIPDTYMAHTFTTGGMVLRWYRDQFWADEMRIGKTKGIDAYDLIDKEVAKVPPGCEGLIMLPHLQGAMAPEINPKAKGVFYGFTLKHTKAYFARAIMEAIACIVRRNIDVLEELHIPVNEIRVLGGGARSDIWNQIKADITRKTILRTENEEAACLGAAILAGKAAGIYDSVKDASRNMVRIKKTYKPQKQNAETYRDTYNKYVELYDDLCGLFSLE